MPYSKQISRVFIAAVTAFVTACGGGGGSGGGAPPAPPPPPPPAVTKAEAFRFLNQTTFGATEAEANRLIALGDSTNAYARWLDEQFAKPASTQLAYVQAAVPNPIPQGFNVASLNAQRVEIFFQNSLRGEDQLRQRVAWALSQIMVVSQNSALVNLPFSLADYYDMLARNAFGDFRRLLEDVTLHPSMGVYLSMLGNQKPDAARNIRPDENYARELMQLFAIGLVELNPDGSLRLVNNLGVPTYDQSIIEGFANVFTGWRYAGAPSFNQAGRATAANQILPMQAYPEQHSTGTKKLLSYTGAAITQIPAGQTPAQDLRDALDNIFNHPNVGPFISKQLIQRLVTSNPTPAYVQRVATVFNNDGGGRRGNLQAVVRAILLDTEARAAPSSANTGKLKEPLLRLTQLWRAYDARSASGRYTGAAAGGPSQTFGQGPLLAPSVFNFYSPFFAPPGEIANQGLVAPELQLATEFLNTTVTNYFWLQVIARTTAQTGLGAEVVFIDTTAETALVADSEALVTKVADKLLGGQISADLKNATKTQVDRTAVTSPNTRVADAIYFVATSPEFALQR
jgi:uncharacterized protein (DUF1800 family)